MTSPKPHKVFCIGFMKTGTTTMNRALTQLGYRVSHKSWQMLSLIFKEDWQTLIDEAAKWDALEDNPIPLIFEELDTAFPESKFILTVRNEDSWYQSVRYHIGKLRSPMHEWLFGKGKGLPIEDEQHTRSVYTNHIDRVKKYFADRPNDLLIVDLSQDSNWPTLCNFLNEPIPNTPFPHANPSRFERDKHAGFARQLKYWKKRMTYPIKVAFHRAMGHLPPPSTRVKT